MDTLQVWLEADDGRNWRTPNSGERCSAPAIKASSRRTRRGGTRGRSPRKTTRRDCASSPSGTTAPTPRSASAHRGWSSEATRPSVFPSRGGGGPKSGPALSQPGLRPDPACDNGFRRPECWRRVRKPPVSWGVAGRGAASATHRGAPVGNWNPRSRNPGNTRDGVAADNRHAAMWHSMIAVSILTGAARGGGRPLSQLHAAGAAPSEPACRWGCRVALATVSPRLISCLVVPAFPPAPLLGAGGGRSSRRYAVLGLFPLTALIDRLQPLGRHRRPADVASDRSTNSSPSVAALGA